MQQVHTAVILAAGKSTRTYPITLDLPKGLLKVLNKTILERTLDELEGIVHEVYIVVAHKKEMIQQHLGKQYKNITIRFVEQAEISGTGGAILQLQPELQGKRFLVINGDDLYKQSDIVRLLEHEYAVLAQKVSEPSQFGVFTVDGTGKLTGLIEKPQKNMGNLVNTGCYLMDDKIFEHELVKSPRGEYEITDYLLYLATTYQVQVVVVQQYWLALGYTWDLLKANRFLLKYDFGEEIQESAVPAGTIISGPVRIGKNVKFGKNVQIIGPVVIGNDVRINDKCYILPYTVIENNVVVEEEGMIAESLIMDGSFIHRDAKKRGAIVTPKYTFSLN